MCLLGTAGGVPAGAGGSVSKVRLDGRLRGRRNGWQPSCRRRRVGGTTLPSPPGEFRWGREGEILACPWHGWEFDLLTGEGLADKRKLRLYPVSIEEDTVFITT